MKKTFVIISIFTLALLMCFLTGCTQWGNVFLPTHTPAPTATESAEPGATTSPDVTPTPTSVPEPTPTAVATPEITPTPTPESSSGPEPTPTATPTPEARDYSLDPVSIPVSPESSQEDLPPLVISEVMSQNSLIYPVENEFYDWIEIYNTTDSSLNLGDFYISDKKSKPQKYRFPEVELEAHGYYVLICSGLDLPGHANFKISKTGEKIYLSDGTNTLDILDVPGDLRANMSYGRYEGKNVYMIMPSPGSDNYNGPEEQTVAVPTANYPGGCYNEKIYVELSGDGDIFYTTDGSKPCSSSKKYQEPIEVDSILSIRACIIKNGETGDTADFTYVINKNHTMPIMTVTIPEECLTGEKGIYTNTSVTYEYEALVTLMENGQEAFSLACGFRLHGKDSRNLPKKNYMLKFRSEYGSSFLNYKVFEDVDCTSFDALILRGGSEDYLNGMMRDELCTSIVNGGAELTVQAFRPVILYINGEYNGIYYIRERIDEYMISDRFNVSPESVTIIFNYSEAEAGTMDEMQELIDFCNTHNLKVKENYDYVISKIDMNSLLDWYICRGFFGDKDSRNMRVFKSSENDGKWRWTFYDLDWGAQHTSNTFSSILCRREDPIFCNLLRNEDFISAMFRRNNYLAETVLTTAAAQEKIQYFYGLLLPEMPADRERWAPYVPAWCTLDMERWETNVNDMMSYFDNEGRIAALKQNIADYFGIPVEVLG